MAKTIIQTKHAPAAIGPYSQAVKTGKLLFVSGQIPIDPETGTVIIGGIEAATHRAMKNIESILSEAGYTFDHVVKATIFIKSMDDFAKINAVYASYFKADYPARETVEVSQLPKNANVEISVVALV